MKQILWAAALMLTLYVPLYSQQFSFHSENPFGIQPLLEDTSNQALRILFSDIDGDDDYDVILAGLARIDIVEPLTWANVHYFFDVQENTGDRWNPVFGERKPLTENFPFPAGHFIPTSGDVNSDGQTDFVIYGIVDFIGNRTMVYCQRNPEGSGQDFKITRMDSMELDDFVPGSSFVPVMVDLDLDGDLDILVSGSDPPFSNLETDPYPVFYYAKNTGSPKQPQFKGWFSNPYGLVSNPLVEIITGTGDLDHDGDMDLIGTMLNIPADSTNYVYVHLNTPANGKPSFNSPIVSPYGLPVGHGAIQYLFPELVDIDGDTDLDLFVFRVENTEFHFMYYENTFASASRDLARQLPISLYPNPTDGLFYIVNKTEMPVENVIVSNTSGKKVLVLNMNGSLQVNMSSLPKGLYMVRMTGPGMDVVRKLIKM